MMQHICLSETSEGLLGGSESRGPLVFVLALTCACYVTESVVLETSVSVYALLMSGETKVGGLCAMSPHAVEHTFEPLG